MILTSTVFISAYEQPSINPSEKNVSNNNGHKFILNETNAIDKVSETDYLKNLSKKYPNVVIFMDDKDVQYIYIYLGFNEGSHTTRKAFVRVSTEETIQYSEIPPAEESDWKTMQ